MTPPLRPVFADTLYWVATVNKRDQYHSPARSWTLRFDRIVTTEAVLVETSASLSRPPLRSAWLILLEQLRTKPKYHVAPFTAPLLARGWAMYAKHHDKAWSLTDCVSFLVMRDLRLTDALTADDHFKQAGFVPLLLADPPESSA